ncbi:sugar MFS transporter [Stenotrophomonas maltophilia]|jgi:glucose/galactose transporter|uniref:sugar MFS transporter n=1 Tax=Stenotrophomonas TaxID=40323 RepID=UPI00066D8C87|nr:MULTISPECIES: sugar MFS transporter [Stenotrophomonas]ARQ91373.1 glucose/galactose MFS transporter [Stenotrophomonas maltophilia]KPG71013.1 MFS transporter [Stenotrophomonas maltophilia]MBA0244877.1 glucose/galactose MFS transporter [Stenotrophomonas maltophilia]MBA0248768.1 glucose/galactose MFS transporter [Stenotrophomonas maltophilia]MBA0308521.1 glucose/galactose MFS transporter [Stenotrophomonas maltophilia]
MSAVPAASARPNVATSIAIVGVLFFLIGFFTWLNGPLITFVKLAFELSEVGAFLVLMVFYLSYFFLALPASWILRRTGMKKGLSLSLLVMAGGAALFGEFATQRWYPGALGGLFVIGSGLALLQTAINPYISILGPIETAARRIALMGICNKIAGMLAPVLIGTVVLHGIGDLSATVAAADEATKAQLLNEFAAKIHAPYLAMAGLLVLLAVAVLFSPLPEIKSSEANATPVAAGAAERRSIFQFPHLWLGVLCLFVYVGVEVMAGDAIGTYGHGFDLPLDQTKMFTSLTLGAMLVGYVVGLLLIPKVVSQSRYLTISAVLGVVFCLGAWATHGYVSVAFVALLGFANAMMWPAIFPLAIRGLGRFTETGSALLVMGIAGGAIIPQLFAVLKQHIDFQLVFVLLMVPCYLYILFYSVIGHRAGLPQDKA